MADEDLVLRASLEDDLSRPAEKVRQKVRAVAEEVEDLEQAAAGANRRLRETESTMRSTGREADRMGRRVGGAGGVTAAVAAGPLSRFNAAAGRTVSRMKASAVAGAAMAGTLVRRVSTGFGIAATAAGLFGIKTAMGLESAETAFTTMLGSAERAKDFLEQLRDFAKATPFEFTGLTEQAQKLIAMGFNAKDVIPTLTSVGNAVAGLGGDPEKLNAITRALGQMKAKNKVQAEEMLQLTEAGVGGWDMLAKKLKVDVPTAMMMVTKGQVDAETGISAVLEGMDRKFGGLMEKQSKTARGTFSNMKDAATMALGDLFRPMLPSLAEFFSWVTKTGIPAIQHFVDELKNGEGTVGKFGDKMGIAFRWMKENKQTVFIFIGVLAGLVVAIAAVNAVMAINPWTLAVVGIALLVTWFIRARQTSEDFREKSDRVLAVLKFLGHAIANIVIVNLLLLGVVFTTIAQVSIRSMRWMVSSVLTQFGFLVNGAAKAFGWVPGIGDKFKAAAGTFNDFKARMVGGLDAADRKLGETRNKLIDFGKTHIKTPRLDLDTSGAKSKLAEIGGIIQGMNGKVVRVVVKGQTGGGTTINDTPTSRSASGGRSGRGHRALQRTLSSHNRINSRLGGGYAVSNALIGGGGRGRGSGDHQRGRAVDVVGRNLPAYAQAVREEGGYAAVHGTGSSKHVHAVMGDTATSRGTSSSGGGRRTIVVQAGAIQIVVPEGSSFDEIKAAVRAALDEIEREYEEADA